ncbi:MAG: heme ABC exporter ATP-binding protein CcmA [Candidatus Rokubacteria bacterium]|nr:heme ABC exporter ATP-binding protein CcmA [Candidatus Rokubacteria bacterium]
MVNGHWAIEAQGLWKEYGSTRVLQDVSLTVAPGEGLVLLGPNGAGKTTLLKILATLIRPTAGLVRIAGYELRRDADAIRRHVGLLAHGSYLYEDLTAVENLQFFATLHGLAVRKGDLLRALGDVDLGGDADQRVREFSLGMKRRLAFARLGLQRPRVLLLDEPFAGLDQQGIKRVEDSLTAFKEEGAAVLMVTHNLGHGLAMADRVAILAAGRVAVERNRHGLDPEALSALYTTHTGDR